MVSTTAYNPEITTAEKTKVNVVIIGDAFVDLICVIDEEKKKRAGTSSNGDEERKNAIIKPGGDVLLQSPIDIMAGGSGINTATHLHSLIHQFTKDTNRIVDVEIQTVFNENDMYGKLLRQHTKDIGFTLYNQGQKNVSSGGVIEKTGSNSIQQELATGHCVVIVSRDGERSFLTHRGCVEYFSPCHVDLSRFLVSTSIDPPILVRPNRTTTNNHHLHVHIAGYYNLPLFWNGALKQMLQHVKEKRCHTGDGVGHFAATTTTISLVPQFDATNQWNGQLLDLLPCVDFLILNEHEAQCITGLPSCCGVSNTSDDENDEKLLNRVAQSFHLNSPSTIIVVTRGSKGAVAIQHGRVIHRHPLPVTLDAVVDTTGAGDAFAGGFLASLMLGIAESGKVLVAAAAREVFQASASTESLANNDDLQWLRRLEHAIRFGCAAGTACTLKKGASEPSTRGEVEFYFGLDKMIGTPAATPSCADPT